MAAWGNYNVIKGQAYNAVPYYYTFQWQQAMNWVRTSTPADAVFNFWWDYGFWVQSIGERASITDGGNSITWWNYLTGRYMLTGDNQLDALTFVHAHNVSYFLIDSTDLTKYGAFSQIGSDANLDRLSFGPVQFTSTKNDIQEKRSTIARAYRASGGYVDEDIFFNNTQIFSGVSYIIGMVVEVNTSTGLPLQPIAIYYNQGMQVRVPLRYIYDGKTFIDFGEGSGIEACFYVVDNANAISGGGAGAGIDRGGAGLYISPRIMRTFLGQVYLLNDPFNNFPAFTLAHSEPDFILSYFNSQLAAGGQAPLTEFAEYQGIKGPIKIWKINYYGNETVMKDSLLREPPDYITWTF